VLRLHEQVQVEPINARPLVAAIPAFVDLWRALRFDDGVIDSTGRRREGLRVISGTHPQAGVRYRLTTARSANLEAPPPDSSRRRRTGAKRTDAAPAGQPTQSTTIEVLKFDPNAVVQLTADDSPISTQIELTTVATPRRVITTIEGRVAGGWPIGGAVRAEVVGHLDAMTGPLPEGVVIDGHLRHRRLRGSMIASIADDSTGGWRIDVRMRLRGRGALRPLGFLASLFLAGPARRSLRRAMQAWPDRAEQLNHWVQQRGGSDPSALARALLDGLLAGVG
jgi:hypothetical protein